MQSRPRRHLLIFISHPVTNKTCLEINSTFWTKLATNGELYEFSFSVIKLCKWQIVQQNNKIYKIWWKTKLIPWHHTVLWNHLSDDTGTSIDWECIKWSHTTCERTVSITLNSSHSYSILLIKFISQTFFKVYTFFVLLTLFRMYYWNTWMLCFI
jgi:hypothetical protein